MRDEPCSGDVMLGGADDGIFTTVDGIAEMALYLAAFSAAALTGQSFFLSHGWFVQ